jgi:yjeF C-terminal region, hydroxyethylthiazole kinase-related/yjeF N-terminal region
MHIVLSAQEMARVEQLAIADGLSQEAFMQEAGAQVARVVKRWAAKGERILLLVGKGNKGGDALAAGWHLLQEGFGVDALMVYEAGKSSELNRLMRERFEESGGKGVSFEAEFSSYAVIVDGLLGTGFRGVVEPMLAQVIERANGSHAPLVAIDLPSGLNGTTGEGEESAIRATATVALGCAKSGFFLRNGWNCVGELFVEEFGLPVKYLEMAKRFAELPLASELERPRLLRNRHKYQAGYVLGYGGSKALSGAPKLASLAALRSGAGIVRLFYPKEAEANMCCCFPELIHAPWDEAAWTHELTRASAIFVGPGLGAAANVSEWLRKHLAHVAQPCVLDADALVADLSCLPKKAVLTPHRGEVLRLLGLKTTCCEEDLLKLCQQFCDKTGAVLVLKGAPTFILGSDRVPKVIPHGDPGMATAGAGDVLTGIIASLLAQGLSCWHAALLGATLHALAGEKIAKQKGSYGLIASDLIEGLFLV